MRVGRDLSNLALPAIPQSGAAIAVNNRINQRPLSAPMRADGRIRYDNNHVENGLGI